MAGLFRGVFVAGTALVEAVQNKAFELDLVCRGLGSAVAIAPPLVIQPEQIEEIGRLMRPALDGAQTGISRG